MGSLLEGLKAVSNVNNSSNHGVSGAYARFGCHGNSYLPHSGRQKTGIPLGEGSSKKKKRRREYISTAGTLAYL